MNYSRFAMGLLAGVVLLVANQRFSVAEDVTLIGRFTIPATATDLSGQVEAQENGTPQNRLGGMGSGIAWLGKGHRYVMVPDRGPDDGATSYRCRIHLVEIQVDPHAASPVTVRLLETHMLTNAYGENFLGRSTYFDREHPERGLRLDPEAIRVTSRGTYLIADEYGPTLREFDAKGKWKRDLPTPDRYRIKNPGATPADELPPHNTSGCQNNRGWEGLAFRADVERAYLITQGPLLQDGALDSQNVRVGTNVRLLEYDLKTGHSREFLYPMEDKTLGVSEVEVIAPNRLLVLERDGKPGDMTAVKHLYEIDLSDATDISKIYSLPSTGIPEGVRPVAKKMFLDLLAPQHSLAGQSIPEKIEGIALGPKLKDGSRVLIVASDNDFRSDQASEIYAFAVK